MYSFTSRTKLLADSGPIEVLIEDERGRNVEYEEFLEELQTIACADRANLKALLVSFISQNEQKSGFWDKGLLRVAEAEAEKDPYDFFEAFLDQAPAKLQKLLFGSRDYYDGYTVLHMAVHRLNGRLARLFTDRCVLFSTKSLLPVDSDGGEIISLYRTKWVLDFIHARTFSSSTALHMATEMGDSETVKQLTAIYDKLEIPSYMVWNFLDKAWMTPLHYAVLLRNETIVKCLLECKVYARHVNVGDWSMRTALHIACSAKTEGPYSDELTLRVIGLLLNSPHVDVNALDCCRFTPLHWAVYVRSIDVVKLILSKAGERTIRSTEEDCDGRTVLQHALTNFNPSEAFSTPEVRKQFYHDTDEFGVDDSNDNEFHKRGKDVERLLLENAGVKGEVERLYRDRQVYVDAANAMLVGSALIASVTFGGWLQAPVGSDHDPAKQETRIFWVFNSLSFFFAVGSVMAGAGAVLPMANVYIGDGVKRVRDWLALTAFLLLISVTCVLGSFAAAGYAAGAKVGKVRIQMTVTSIVGSVLCLVIGLFFVRGLYNIRPVWAQFLVSQQTSRSFKMAEKEAKTRHRLWAYITRFKNTLRLSWLWLRGTHAKQRTSMHHQYMHEALRKRAFERAFRLVVQNSSKYWPWLRSSRVDVKRKLETRVYKSFEQAFQKLKKDCEHPDKHEKISQCVNDECPPGFRKTAQRTSSKPYLSRGDSGQYEDVDEVLEEIVIEMVTQCSGRGLLHIFLDLPTTSCRDICLRNNMLDFKLTPFSGS